MNRLLAAFFIIPLLAAFPGRAATGGAPLTMSHSGYLLDGTDHPVSATVDLKFRIFDAQGFGNVVWEGACAAVPVLSGYYTVVLGGPGCVGTSGGLDPTLDTNDLPTTAARWLEAEMGGTTLAPRMAISTVPTAAVANRALEADRLAGELPAAYHDAASLTGVAPASVLGTGSAGLTTVGTITTGTWSGTPIAEAFVAGANGWNAKLAAVAHDGTLVGAGTAASQLGVNVGLAAGSVAAGNDARFGQWSGTATGLDAPTARTSLGLGTAATADSSAFATATQGSTADTLAAARTADVPVFFYGRGAASQSFSASYAHFRTATTIKLAGKLPDGTTDWYDASAGTFTAPAAGIYSFEIVCLLQSVSAGAFIDPRYFWGPNGANYNYYGPRYYFNAATYDPDNYYPIRGSALLYLNAGEQFWFNVGVSPGTAVAYAADAGWGHMSGMLVRRGAF